MNNLAEIAAWTRIAQAAIACLEAGRTTAPIPPNAFIEKFRIYCLWSNRSR